MPQNSAAWITAKFAALTVADAPYTEPESGQILVRNRAVAINPVDRYKQKLGNGLYGWVKYPFILGFDLAGEVAAVGPGVTRFKVGDRVLAHATGLEKVRNKASESAFQLYTVVLAHMASAIPDTLSFDAAAVLPLALSTAACGLFEPQHLALDRPRQNPTDKGKTVLIWGGSTSVGNNAIQLAVAAGYRVVTTASPKNFNHVKALGATEVFEYHCPNVVPDIQRALNGRQVAGALAIGGGSAAACIDVLATCNAPQKVAIATFPLDIDSLPDRPGLGTILTKLLPMMVVGGGGLWLRAKRKSVTTSTIWGSSLMDTDLGPAIYAGFLPLALQSGGYIASPQPLIVGHGLDAIQKAFDRQKEGVSNAKIVVTL